MRGNNEGPTVVPAHTRKVHERRFVYNFTPEWCPYLKEKKV